MKYGAEFLQKRLGKENDNHLATDQENIQKQENRNSYELY
jgi:hypothetical protein